MSEEDLTTTDDASDLDLEEFGGGSPAGQFEDFEQNGLLLKIATDGISVQDYVKRLKESDILVAVDGELFLEGPAELENRFRMEAGDGLNGCLHFIVMGNYLTYCYVRQFKVSLDWLPNKKLNGRWSNSKHMFMVNSQNIKTLKFTGMGLIYAIF